MTLGCSVNSGTALTMPSTFSTSILAEIAGRSLGGGQQTEADQLGVLVGLLDGDVAADLAGHHGAVVAARALARQVERVAVRLKDT